MASKLRSARETQKADWQGKLDGRMSELKELGLDGKGIEKDAVIRKLKAKVREASFRLSAIVAGEKKIEDMARIKEEKKAAPPKEKGKKAAPVEDAKAKKKEKKKEPKKKAEAAA